MHSYAAALGKRFQVSNHVEDLHRAISLNEEVLELWSSEHPERCNALKDMASRLIQQYDHSRNRDALDKAYKWASEANTQLTSDSPRHADVRLVLASSLFRFHGLMPDGEYLQRAFTSLEEIGRAHV